MGAENDIIIKITGEADLDAAQKQLQELTKRSKDYEKQIDDNKVKEKQVSASLRNSIKDRKELSDVLVKTQEHYRNQRKALQDNIKANKQSIKALTDSINGYKTLQGQTGRAVQQLRAMREELMRMEDAGEFGTEAFMELSIRAGELEDRIGDVQQRIRILASDTKNLDALAGIGEALSGGFYIATSAAELFGDEMEGLQKAFYKVQAAMSIVNGVQSLYNALNKDSAAMVVLNTALLKIYNKVRGKSAGLMKEEADATASDNKKKGISITLTTIQTAVTGGLTKAVHAFNKALKANPIGFIIGLISGAIGLIKAFIGLFSRENEHAKNFKKIMAGYEAAAREYEARAAEIEYNHERRLKKIDQQEEISLAKARRTGASQLEQAKISEEAAKKRVKAAEDILKAEGGALDFQINWLQKAIQEKKEYLKTLDTDSNKYKENMEELQTTMEKYYGLLRKKNELEDDVVATNNAAKDAEFKVEEEKLNMKKQSLEIENSLRKDGAAKEIAQIKIQYADKLKELKDNNAETIRLRKALLAQQAREIEEVRKKYAIREAEAELQSQKNLLAMMAQSRGSEKDYQVELALTKKVAEEEARIQIASLDKRTMSEKEYQAQVVSIIQSKNEKIKQIDNDEAERQAENQRRLTEITIQEATNRKNALTGKVGADEQKAIVKGYYDALKKQLEENARLEREAVERSTDTEEVKAAKIKGINAKLKADLAANERDSNEELLAIDEQYLTDLEITVSKAEDRLSKAQTTGDKLSALREQKDAQLALYDEQQRQLNAKWEAGLISFSDYKQQEWEIEKATVDAEVQYRQDAMQTIADGFNQALGYMQQISDMAFEAVNQNIQAEMDALDEEYTTDWEEAQKNADKKYITEKEYEKKKADLEMKQAKYAKAQALTNIGIQTAQAIITTLAQLGATPWGIAASVLAGSMGAAQLAVAAAKPLAQYEKGRKGGKGEYAIVGEKGAEIMYIPQGASIIPNNKIEKPAEWAKFGVPELPHSDPEILRYVSEQAGIGLTIDYDRMGASVAKHLPKQRNVTVNVDRSGVSVNDGSQHTYLNAKYNGSWN